MLTLGVLHQPTPVSSLQLFPSAPCNGFIQYLASVSSAASVGPTSPSAVETAKGSSEGSRGEANCVSSPGPQGLQREKTWEKAALEVWVIAQLLSLPCLNPQTLALICVLGNTAKVGFFNINCFCAQLYCSHPTDITGFLSVLQQQEQWDSTIQQQINPIWILIFKSKWENELLLQQEKRQGFLAQKPGNAEGAQVQLLPARGTELDKGVPGVTGTTGRETPALSHASKHRAQLSTRTMWLKENNLETHSRINKERSFAEEEGFVCF